MLSVSKVVGLASEELKKNGYMMVKDNVGSSDKNKKSFSIYGPDCIMGPQMNHYRIFIRNNGHSAYVNMPGGKEDQVDKELNIEFRYINGMKSKTYKTKNLSSGGVSSLFDEMIRYVDKPIRLTT